jgi:hypothetical protein
MYTQESAKVQESKPSELLTLGSQLRDCLSKHETLIGELENGIDNIHRIPAVPQEPHSKDQEPDNSFVSGMKFLLNKYMALNERTERLLKHLNQTI